MCRSGAAFGWKAILLLTVLRSSALAAEGPQINTGAAAPSDDCAAPRQTSAIKEICAADDARYAAMLKGDPAALAPLLGDDLRYTHSDGRSESKSEFLARLSTGSLRYEAITPLERDVRPTAGNAVILGRVVLKVRTDGRPLNFEARFLEIYERRAGRWVLVAWQSTRVRPL